MSTINDRLCHKCSGELTLREQSIEHKVGRHSNWSHLQLLTCKDCKEYTLSAKRLFYLELAAVKEVFLDEKHDIGSEELRSARKILGDTHAELGARLGVPLEIFSREEVSTNIPAWLRYAVVGLCCKAIWSEK